MESTEIVRRVGSSAGSRDETRRTGLMVRKETHFVLWHPRFTEQPPALFFQRFVAGQGIDFSTFRELELARSVISADLFEIAASECGLVEGGVYLYWFKLRDASLTNSTSILYCTDPFAWAVDRSTLAPAPPVSNGVTVSAPASIVAFRGGRLVPSDLDGRPIPVLGVTDPAALAKRAPNNRMVIYELPTRWTAATSGGSGSTEVGTGTFAHVSALIAPNAPAPSFPDLAPPSARGHLLKLGVNALELLPPADSPQDLEWGYGTANYFAADFELGRPQGQWHSEATSQLVQLVQDCHAAGIRFFPDVVMAFTRENPSRLVSFTDLLVEPGTGDPAEFRNSDHGSRAGFGGNPWRYDAKGRAGFDPVAGRDADSLIPARQYMKAYVSHWMDLYGIDGVRVDDIADIDNWDFNREFTQHARDAWQAARGDTAKFIVISEELGKPAELVCNGSTDAAWNEPWKRILRAVILGKNAESENEPSFEHSVRMLIDCRLRGFSDLAQAVNYLGSHDVGGFRNERIFNFLANNGVRDIGDISRRLRLAYAVLLTAAGIPMIFAGDEFADSQDLPLTDFGDRNKQIDPVNFSRLNEPWRRELFDYVARLVRLRVTHDGLARNETEFLHADFNDKRVLVWQRGLSTDPVVVVANFSDFGSAGGLAGEYFIPNFPRRDAEWFEVSQGEPRRRIARGAIGREPLFPWEAKVYMIATN